jgi:hypothetical protein
MKLPILHIFTTKELQDLAMREVLRQNGVADPETFVREHNVMHAALFRLDAGVMSTTILSIETITKEADPIPLVSK